jgi:hypothetical protein
VVYRLVADGEPVVEVNDPVQFADETLSGGHHLTR